MKASRLQFLGTILLALFLCHAEAQQTTGRRSSLTPAPVPNDLQPISYQAALLVPRWLSAQFYGTQPPLPVGCVPRVGVDLQLFYSPSANAIFIGDQDVDYSALETDLNSQLSMSPMMASPLSQAEQTLDPSSLFLQITNVSNGLLFANLWNATNQVYAIWGTTDLLASWNVETEVWPTNQVVMPFTVSMLNRPRLFLRAMDWTGVTENGNTVPDWWLWEYFGTTALSDSTLDSQGHTLLYDYQKGLDPNVIQFTLSADSFYVNQSIVSAYANISAGVPSFYAILVNDTNYANANWQAFAGTNLTVNLGSTQGVYNVLIGLRGLPKNATATWQSLQFTLSLAGPQLVITSPTTNTLTQSLLQLTGYSPAPLGSISYDLSNAAGLITAQQVLVTDQYYDPQLAKFTTNTFQAYDVVLTNGVNTITLHATDLAGNASATTVSFTLDYSSKTNPPAVQITWPQDGTQISGTNFTLDGQVDDPTVKVSVSVADTNGNTNVVNGTVERTGKFWVEEIPLSAGTNNLTLTVTDVAGNTNVMSLNVVQTPITLTIDDVNPDSLWQPTVNLTGKISDPSYAVWVNGVKGHNDGYGSWSANNVPVNKGGTASFTATGYAPDEQQPDGSYGN